VSRGGASNYSTRRYGIIAGVNARSPAHPVYDLSRADLAALVADLGEPHYRGDQVWRWLYRQLAGTYDEMTNLSLALRQRLADRCPIPSLTVADRADSGDGLTTKYLLRLADGQLIETVLMHYVDPADEVQPGDKDAGPGVVGGRHTVCLSTQVGCALGCVFCATGQMGLVRDLSRGECVAQVVHCSRELARLGARLSNVVFMGMGEPLANWPATWGAIETLIDRAGFGLSPRRLTVSTVGFVPGILQLAATDLPLRLAVSLHAPDDELRSQLVPIGATWRLAEILAACREYQARGGRRVTFEYVLIAGVNDRPDQARLLARRLHRLRAHINLIPLNPTAGCHLRPSDPRTAEAFRATLEMAGVPSTVRSRRGIDIEAGCGQLRSRAGQRRLGRTMRPVSAGERL
jgi:23S rRNA (adenine2503-C2)-methyltransferase